MRTTLIVVTLIAGLLSGTAFAAAKDQEFKSNIERRLASPYALAKLTADKVAVAGPGTLFTVRLRDFMGSTTQSLLSYQNIYKNGKITHSFGNAFIQNKEASITFMPGDPFFLTRVEAKDDGIVYHFISANPFGGSHYGSKLTIPFPKGSIATVDPGQIQQALNEVFTADAPAPPAVPQPASQQAPPPEPSPQAAPQPVPTPAPPAPATIALGQTFDQVIAAVGKPEKIVKLGDKEIYFYKDLKVTFLNGKVSDAQ